MHDYLSGLSFGMAVKSAAALAVAGATSLMDVAHPSILPLAALMLLDFLLGAAHALKERRFNWSGIRRGVVKFVVYGIALIVTSLADKGIGTETFLTWSLCCYLIACEALSALGHLTDFGGPKLPPWLFDRLEAVKARIENDPTPARHEENNND